ncbi:hypothetical protein STEG23_034125 [Scotinomys teguina]
MRGGWKQRPPEREEEKCDRCTREGPQRKPWMGRADSFMQRCLPCEEKSGGTTKPTRSHVVRNWSKQHCIKLTLALNIQAVPEVTMWLRMS